MLDAFGRELGEDAPAQPAGERALWDGCDPFGKGDDGGGVLDGLDGVFRDSAPTQWVRRREARKVRA